MTRENIKKVVHAPSLVCRLDENETLANAVCLFSAELKKKGCALTLYLTGDHSNSKMWGVYSIKEGRPRLTKNCKYLSQTFSSVGKTNKCLAYTSLVALQKRVLEECKKAE